MKNRNSILGVLFASLLMATMVLVTHEPLDTKSNTLQALIVHCTATPEHVDATADQIGNYFLRPAEKGGRGWEREGYHDIIEKDGNVVSRIQIDDDDKITYSEIANGAAGYNRIARHVSYIGGLDRNRKPKNTLTEAQDSSLKEYVFRFLEQHPKAYILGHNQVAAKACPSFNVIEKMREYNIPEDNIYKFKHRGKKIELLNSTDIIHCNDSRSDILQQEVLLSSIPLPQVNRFKHGNNYPGSNQGYHTIYKTRLCYNKCVA